MLTTIPFSGFYNSMHDDQIDWVIESMLSDSSGCHPISQRLADEIWSHTGDVRAEYSKAFTEGFQGLFNSETGLDVEFEWESVNSPRAYNFSTDRVFATVSLSDVRALFRKVDWKALDHAAKERFTSCDGFISHYSPYWRTWGSMTEWDHNQIGTLIEALVSQFLGENWEWDIIEGWSGAGHLDNWVYSALDEEGKRLVKIADYLRQREERQYR